MKNTVKILIIGLAICVLLGGSLCYGYKATKVTYTITGSTGLAGVVIKGLPGEPVTDDNGSYSAKVEYGWSGTATPVKEGYNFAPAERKYEAVSAELSAQDYTASLINYQISGSVGVSGVVMSGVPGEPVTDKEGNFTALVGHGWSGTITPTKEGYTFKPINRSYDKVTSPQANQNYTASLISFAVSGTVMIGGVPMEGVAISADNGGGSAVTNDKGQYSITVNYGWSGEITPKREGYTFDLPSRKYSEIAAGTDNQNYTAQILTCTVSGTITSGDSPLAGVVMYGLPGDPVTNENGYYSTTVNYGWSNVVTPTKPGYVFTPVNKTYEPIAAHQTQNYAAKLLTYTIRGSVGISGAVMTGLPGEPTTDSNGQYSATVNYGWSGTVIPTKEGHRFNPSNRIYESVKENQERNYTPEVVNFIVSGTVAANKPVSGVVMKGLPGEPVTDNKGNYSAVVAYGWNGTVTPVKEGCVFEPDKKLYSKVTEDQPQDYQAQILTYIISGSVTTNGNPVADAAINASNDGGAVRTDANGQYELIVKHGWSGTITPVKEGWTFDLPKQEYNKVTANVENQNYKASIITCSISGKIILDGVPIEGVLVTADNEETSCTTNAKGEYSVTVNYGWSGMVSPTKAGLIFDPPGKRYINVTSSIVEKEEVEEETLKPEPPIQAEAPEQNLATENIAKEVEEPKVTEPAAETPEVNSQPEPAAEPAAEPATEPAVEPAVEPEAETAAEPNNEPKEETKAEAVVEPAAEPAVEPAADPAVEPNAEPAAEAVVEPTSEPAAQSKDAPADEPVVIENAVEPKAEPKVEPKEEPEVEPNSEAEAEPKAKEEILPAEPQAQAAVGEPQKQQLEKAAPQPKQPLISNVFVDTELRQVLQDISSQAGVTIIPDQTVSGLISCELKEVPLDKALEIVLAGTGYMVKKTPDYYLISSPNPKDAAFTVSSQTKIVKLNYLKADAAVKLLSPVFANYVQAYADTGTVCITAPSALMERIEADIKEIDKAPSHIMLDARVVVMQNSDMLDLGIEWGWPKIRAGIFSDSYQHGGGAGIGGRWPWGVSIGYGPGQEFTNALEITLNLLEKNGEATIVSSPQVLAQDGKQAEIRITTEEYYSLLPKYAEGSPYYYNPAELEKIEYGTILNITPHIGENGDITLDMAIEVSDIVMRSSDNYPVVSRRVVKNTMRIKDGGTVTVAGLKKSESYKTDQKVPGLSKAPLIGGLFKNQNNQESSQQVAIFVTAHLIPNPEVSSRLSELPATLEKPIKPVGDEFKGKLEEQIKKQ